ncbi:hypothetical protein [Roseibium aggregatum]|uniref:Cytochrome c n=1 Tax=Roseibium aggregatum TaxID=187304 RepID=A0A939IZR9_9HYPH|nr:hypothetical protein [Roseibium aggregatum]MBN9670331.1 hypothetical protein [Roseibium aggregatum]
MRRTHPVAICSILSLWLCSCAIGPGTPLVDALKANPGTVSSNVPPPKGYGSPVGGAEASGLINARDREATEAYLKSLASE